MKKHLLLLLALPVLATAQYRRHDSNHIGISGGINQFDLYTSDLNVKPGTGWNASLSLRGNWYNDFDMVYGIQFCENNFSAVTTLGEDVDFKLSSAQIYLTPSYEIIENHLSVEFGPMVQINGDLTFDKQFQSTILDGTTLTVKEISKVSRVSFYPTVGITGGFPKVRLNVTYQYGVNNLFSKTGKDISAHGGILAGNIIFYL